jgi:hypothetical protein
MKLEYLNDLTDGGKYIAIPSENLIRLYDFESQEATLLQQAIKREIIENNKSLELANLNFIAPLNCALTLRINEKQLAITTDKFHFFCTPKRAKRTDVCFFYLTPPLRDRRSPPSLSADK